MNEEEDDSEREERREERKKHSQCGGSNVSNPCMCGQPAPFHESVCNELINVIQCEKGRKEENEKKANGSDSVRRQKNVNS